MATAAWLTSIWVFRFLPMHDYPVWVYAGRILSQLMRHQAPWCYSVVHIPVPNTWFLGIIGLLDLVLPPEISAKILLSLSVVLYILGSYRLFVAIAGRRDSPLLLLPLLYVFNRSVWVGEISYELSLGILFLALAYVVSIRHRLQARDVWAIAGLSMVIFFSHAVALFCWLMFLTLLAVLDSRRFPRFQTLLAMSPALLLLAYYVGHRGSSSTGLTLTWFGGFLSSKLEFVSIFSPLHFFDPYYWTDPKALKLLATVFNLSVVAAVVTLSILWLASLRHRWGLGVSANDNPRAVVAAPLVFFIVYLLVPFSVLTRVHDFNGRFLLPAFILILASLASYQPERLLAGKRWWPTLAAASAIVIVLAFQFLYVGRVAHKLRGVYDVLTQAHLGSDFRDLADTEFENLGRLAPRPSSGPRLLPVHESLAYFVQYLRLKQSAPIPLFPTTTSIIKTSVVYHPLLDESKRMTEFPGSVVILGLQARNRVIAGLMADRYDTITDTEGVLIMRRKAEYTEPPALDRRR